MTAIALKLGTLKVNRSHAAGLTPRRTTSRTIVHQLDLAAVLSLMASSTAYAAWALAHLA